MLYTIFAFAGLMSMFLSPLPCLVLSVAGTVFAAKAGKEGIAGARKSRKRDLNVMKERGLLWH